VLYVFGTNFFTEIDTLDHKATFKANTAVWTRKPRVVNFCPYCRAVLGATWMIPFVYVWRLYPHKEKKQLTHGQIMRRMKIRQILLLSIGGGINIVLGVSKLFHSDDDYQIGIIQIGIGVGMIVGFQFAGKLALYLRKLVDFIVKDWPKKKVNPEKVKKNPSFLKAYLGTYLSTKHHKICPPVAFIDSNDADVRV